MFPFPIAKPQKCDIQTFYGGSTGNSYQRVWNKPVGVSHVYMMLIGAGGNGSGGGSGGGSGAVTVWYGAAQHVPEILRITFGTTASAIAPMFNLSSILTANHGSSTSAGAASATGPFAASGFFTSTAGQAGALGTLAASSTTFLSGGSGGASVTGNYGYNNASNNGEGYFQMQPIIVGVGGVDSGSGGIGCGGGSGGSLGTGGAGMVLIASW